MRKKFLIQLKATCAGLLIAGAALLFTGCVVSGHGYAYAPGPDGFYYYDYYPESHVYYHTQAHIYYWNVGGSWHSGRQLPHGYHFHAESPQQVRVHSREPWLEHHP